MTEMGA
ncbi:hypothetical protein A2U01_0063731 [Trifolium medium]|nr:hypothetical protein [Trifolium medium]